VRAWLPAGKNGRRVGSTATIFSGLVLATFSAPPRHSGDRAARADAGDDDVDLAARYRASIISLRAVRAPVDLGIGGVGKLLEDDAVPGISVLSA